MAFTAGLAGLAVLGVVVLTYHLLIFRTDSISNMTGTIATRKRRAM